jgi:uncharacterized protein (DUF4415 family)
MPKLKPGTVVPTPEEDAAITAAAMQDPDALPYTDEEWAEVKPVRGRGRPPQAVTKVPMSVRLSPSVLDAFRKSGNGWQTRVDQALFEYANSNALFERYGDIDIPEFYVKESGEALYNVGKYAYPHSKLRSFTDALCHYLMEQLGEDWLKNERHTPWEKKHPIAKWDSILLADQSNNKEPHLIGALAAWAFLGYHLYLIREYSQMKTRLMKRLKQPDQFQGARFEVTVAAALLTSGFDVDFIDENSNGKHPDFIATSRATNQRFAVEVKRKHRPGVLSEGPEMALDEPSHIGIDSLLFKAVEKDPDLPLIVFIDVNLPGGIPASDSNVAKELQQSWATLDKSPWQTKGFPCVGAFFYNDRAPWLLDKEMPANNDHCWMICMPSLHRHKFDAIPYLRQISGGFAKTSRIPQVGSDVNAII